MASTKIVRKLRRKRSGQARKKNTIKVLSYKPVIKNVDIEELKAQFGGAKKTAKKAAPKKEEAPAEPKEEAKVEEAPAAESTEENKEA